MLLESGTAQGNAAVVYQENSCTSSGDISADAESLWNRSKSEIDSNRNRSLHLPKPVIFQPHLDLINSSKSSEEELNVTKSSVEGFTTKIEEMNSDEDSGHSSANSSGNEESKKNLQNQEVRINE